MTKKLFDTLECVPLEGGLDEPCALGPDNLSEGTLPNGMR